MRSATHTACCNSQMLYDECIYSEIRRSQNVSTWHEDCSPDNGGLQNSRFMKKKHWLISRLCMKGFRLFFRIRFYCYSDYDIVIDFNFFGLRFFFCGFDQQFLWSCFFLFFVVDIFVCASVFFTLVSILKWTQMHEATSNAPISMTWAFKIPLRLHKSSVWMW